MTNGPETLEMSHDILEMSPEARVAEIQMLEEIWEMPPGGGGGGFPPIDIEKKYGGDRPEPEEPSRHTWRDIVRFLGSAVFFGGHLGNKAYSSGHAVPDNTGTVPGGFRLHEASDAHSHQWDVASTSMPDSWIESSPRRLGY